MENGSGSEETQWARVSNVVSNLLQSLLSGNLAAGNGFIDLPADTGRVHEVRDKGCRGDCVWAPG